MKQINSVLVAILFALSSATAHSAQNVTKGSGGTIQTKAYDTVLLNKKSSMTREWITIHDQSIPIELIGTVGVKTVGGLRRNDFVYNYSAEFSIKPKEAISAFEVRFIIFDLWGNHTKNLSTTEVMDIAAGKTEKFDAAWNLYSENEASEYYASIAYIARARTKAGKVYEANYKIVLEQARKLSKKFTKEDLEPKPEKK